jgi:hypothetical protein
VPLARSVGYTLVKKNFVLYLVIWGLVLLIGIILLIFGQFLATYWETAIIALGSAILGVSLAALISSLSKWDFMREIYQTLSVSTESSPRLISNEEYIKKLRINLYKYHVTQISGKHVWRCTTLDFAQTHIPGQLHSILIDSVHPEGKQPKKHEYSVTAGKLGESLIIIAEALNTDQAIHVELYPYYFKQTNVTETGILFHSTWDNTREISPCLLSPMPLFDCVKNGTVEDRIALRLDAMWREGINYYDAFFPRQDCFQNKCNPEISST